MKRAAFVIALFASIPLGITGQEGEGPSLRPVTWERLLNAADEPENWLMYNGTLDSQRFSGLEQIHSPVSYTHLTLPTTPYV